LATNLYPTPKSSSSCKSSVNDLYLLLPVVFFLFQLGWSCISSTQSVRCQTSQAQHQKTMGISPHTLTDFFSSAAAGATIEREGTVPIASLVRHSEEQSSGFTAAPLSETTAVLLVDQAGKLGEVHAWRATESAVGVKTDLRLGVTADRRDRAARATLENGSILKKEGDGWSDGRRPPLRRAFQTQIQMNVLLPGKQNLGGPARCVAGPSASEMN
jgi:hypothetical protein